MNNFVIAITRTCGSGGTTIGKMLAEHYGIEWYDKELLKLASEDSGISYELFEKADSTLQKKPLFRAYKKVYRGELIPPESSDFTSNDNLFNYQAKVLKELAKQESYVVVGRAADFILKDFPRVLRVFIYASHENCLRHEMEVIGSSREEAEEEIAHKNAYREAYYEYHTGNKWLDARNYDLILDTGRFSYEECVMMIRGIIENTLIKR